MTINVDITLGIALATWEFEVDCIEVIPEGTPFKNGDNTVPAGLGALLFSSVSGDTEFYIDDINFISGTMDCILDINDLGKINFSIYPNPSQNFININTQEAIKNIIIYNVQGSSVIEPTIINKINISSLSAGLYFVEVSTDKGRSVQKLIKN